jgi:hypothetical protein
MMYEDGHPDVTLSDWEKFCNEFSHYLIEEVLDRHEANLPTWFMPLARGGAIASDELLRQAGYRHGKYRPRGWLEFYPDYFRFPLTFESSLLVRGCEGANLWTIERLNATRRYEVDEVLAFVFGSTPIFTRSYQSAMRLAMHCHVNGTPSGLRWIKGNPSDPTAAIEFARKRRFDEGYAR